MIPPMKSCRIQVFALVLAGLIGQPALAEVIPGRWEKVSDLELRTSITVELKNGDQVEGRFNGLSASELELETHSARAMVPKADIQMITAPAKDGLAEGTAIGTAIGTGFVGVVAATSGLRKGLDTSAKGVSMLQVVGANRCFHPVSLVRDLSGPKGTGLGGAFFRRR